ncbi:PcfJ domain-containing protein [Alicyclobacillus hesperidum]|uniref:PcfJ domain-containing protein n=1 Tax=Alicyclobacillus hesperidum TaxID=89784 RepID=UPI0002E87794|nr:PcfJ domain-containing protein [Alicyclobacillus hesperidum]
MVKHRGRGRKHLIDTAYIVWYEKSMVDAQTVVATWYYAWRDYSGDFYDVETHFQPRARYVFVPGQGGTMMRLDWSGEWKPRRNVHPLPVGAMGWHAIDVWCSHESIRAAVAGTPLQYSGWETYCEQYNTLLTFFDLAAKYRCVEYLTKLGFVNLVMAKLDGRRTYGAIHWRGRTMEQVFRMPRRDVYTFRAMASTIEPLSLHSYHVWRCRGWDVSPVDAHLVRELCHPHYWRQIEARTTFASEVEIAKYLLKQVRTSAYHSPTYALIEWHDYLRHCEELGIPLTSKRVVFPSNLRDVHDKMMRRVQIKRDERLNEQIQARLAELEPFIYTDGRFVIRPARSVQELFEEGQALHHCVGSYAAKYASGETDLFVMRLASAPDTPLCTIEMQGDVLRQARGERNRPLHEDEQAFVDQFVRRIAQRRERHRRQKAS